MRTLLRRWVLGAALASPLRVLGAVKAIATPIPVVRAHVTRMETEVAMK